MTTNNVIDFEQYKAKKQVQKFRSEYSELNAYIHIYFDEFINTDYIKCNNMEKNDDNPI